MLPLTVWLVRMPDDPFASDLQAMDERRRDCALAHAVDEAVAARAAVISARVSPGPLAAHVAAAMRRALPEGSWLCEEEEPQFLAPPYRWVLVLEALQAACRDGLDGRHPHSAEWERDYGRPIPGQDCAAQPRPSPGGTTTTSAMRTGCTRWPGASARRPPWPDF